MLTSTAPDASARLLLRLDGPDRGARLPVGCMLSTGLCSTAGLHRRPWLARLRRAMARGTFALHFQPIVSLDDRRVCHHEALLRLADEPDGALVAPGHFLPAAERYGLVGAIDRMVVERVAARLALERDADSTIAVNVSALSVIDQTMLAHIESCLQWHAVEPARLVVEVTETAVISDMAAATRFCAGVLTLGCGLALDDFGAGFGSFQYLRHLPFSHLKIDGQFISQLPACKTDRLLVSALAGLVRGMGAKTIAEFVGDEATIRVLRECGVDYAQGFAIGRPQPELMLAA